MDSQMITSFSSDINVTNVTYQVNANCSIFLQVRFVSGDVENFIKIWDMFFTITKLKDKMKKHMVIGLLNDETDKIYNAVDAIIVGYHIRLRKAFKKDSKF